jgi:hypothetical protein
MTQALYAHMNNKRKKKRVKKLMLVELGEWNKMFVFGHQQGDFPPFIIPPLSRTEVSAALAIHS